MICFPADSSAMLLDGDLLSKHLTQVCAALREIVRIYELEEFIGYPFAHNNTQQHLHIYGSGKIVTVQGLKHFTKRS